MTTSYTALLRAVNLPAHGKIAMKDLTAAIADLGLQDVRSLLQSGNVVFRGDERTPTDLERVLEKHVEKSLGLRTTFFVRTAEDLDDVIAHNPFPDDAKTDPGHLVVEFLKDAPAAAGVKQLQAAIKGPETVRARGKHVYIVYPAGIGRSKLTNKLIEDKLGTRGTGRNWNTVLKLAAMVHA